MDGFIGDTIAALATPQGAGAIAVIRLSGPGAISITNKVFKGKDLSKQPSHTIHYGHIMDGDKEVDEVMVSLFRAPKSFTTEDVVEISCHGSPFVAEQILRLLIQQGARAAKPGEFTLRAFMNGRIDLSQAEAVADLIASESSAAQELALKQMRGGVSSEIKTLRQELVHFASLLELELDFGEEDVEFADRKKLVALTDALQAQLKPLIESFQLGNVIKQGINTVIVGRPNAGKSTLLNLLLNEERAIVSEIPGTTRDTIEEVINIEGIRFRFMDTAGIRNTTDVVEKIGVERTMEKLKQSSVYLYLFDVNTTKPKELLQDLHHLGLLGFKGMIIGNKIDKAHWQNTAPFYRVLDIYKTNVCSPEAALAFPGLLYISSQTHFNLSLLKEKLYRLVMKNSSLAAQSTVITNLRHHQALVRAKDALDEVKAGIEKQISTDLIALEVKQALQYLGEITGEVTNDEILGNIFSKFCIGK
ncbi:MAG: tRNA uridine-5-carboxymethylaminomethyl(34) synthesis GTPase MnmE [Bacteroidetes bacterium]|nr:tRNA uridine-5-carboxymethylaminomethyl(34) synthesis GTPase MnmE [Bacteroidota bacterium]